MKRGGPLGLQKGEEQELECKPPFVFLLFFVLATCYLQGDDELQACHQVL
jgi:hypothetical protein